MVALDFVPERREAARKSRVEAAAVGGHLRPAHDLVELRDLFGATEHLPWARPCAPLQAAETDVIPTAFNEDRRKLDGPAPSSKRECRGRRSVSCRLMVCVEMNDAGCVSSSRCSPEGFRLFCSAGLSPATLRSGRREDGGGQNRQSSFPPPVPASTTRWVFVRIALGDGHAPCGAVRGRCSYGP